MAGTEGEVRYASAAGTAGESGGDDDVFEDDLIGVDPTARLHDGMPIRGYHYGEPVPDFGRLPRERWRELLRPLRHGTRQAARNTARTQEDVIAAGILVGELLLEDGPKHGSRLEEPPRMPAGAAPATGPSRQVNFRLGRDEHARLIEAGRLFGMRPTALARVLTIRGVNRALYEERRDR